MPVTRPYDAEEQALRSNTRTATQGHVFILCKALADRLVDLESAMHAQQARIAELERAPMRYDGPHEAGKVYDKGVFVTRDGSLWHCNYKTASTPGDGPAWVLAVKRGKDSTR